MMRRAPNDLARPSTSGWERLPVGIAPFVGASAATSNGHIREDLNRVADEQAALRRVATLVTQGASPDCLFAVVAEQVARVLEVPFVSIVRYESDGTVTMRASFAPWGEAFPVGGRWSVTGTSVVARVRESARAARIDDYSGLEGEIAEAARGMRIGATVGIPIVVAGRLWGAVLASAMTAGGLPAGTESRLATFTELDRKSTRLNSSH